jgi:hypothetical protein
MDLLLIQIFNFKNRYHKNGNSIPQQIEPKILDVLNPKYPHFNFTKTQPLNTIKYVKFNLTNFKIEHVI